MEFSIKKSFKSHGSYKHMQKISAGSNASSHEELPILLDQELGDRPRDVLIKMDVSDSTTDIVKDHDHHDPSKNVNIGHEYRQDGNRDYQESSSRDTVDNNKNVKSESFEFMMQRGEDPSRLINQFLNKQKTNGEVALDMDLEMEELKQMNNNNYQNASPQLTSYDQSREIRVSFGPNPIEKESVRRRYKDSPEGGGDTNISNTLQQSYNNSHGDLRKEEVLKCTANASFNRNLSFQRKPSLLMKTKTRSRLQDPPQEEIEMISDRLQKSGQLRSGMLAMGMGADDDEDPLWIEDLPEEFTRYNLSALTLLQWVSLIVIVAALGCSLAIPYLKQKSVWNLELWKWEVMVLVLICGRLVSGWGIRIIVFFVERNFLLRKRLLYFVYGVRKAVQNCLWLGLVLLAWDLLFDRKVRKETDSRLLKYITKVLVCLLIGTLLWLVKTLMIKVLASSFHVSTYFDRIQESLFNQFVIETLSGPPLIEIQRVEEDMERTAAEVGIFQNAGAILPPDLRDDAFQGSSRSGRVIGRSSRLMRKSNQFSGPSSKKVAAETGITIDHLHKLNHKNISAWNMKRLVNMVRHGSLSTLDEQILGVNANEDESAKEIRSEFEAKIAARKIFLNVARPGSKYIDLEDLMRFMQEEEALKTMSLFEGAVENSRISKSSLKHWVVNSFRERRALALTLNDTKTAVNKLRHVVNIMVAAVILVIWLVILEIATSQFLLFVSSQLVLVAFVFGNTCKTIFEALIFLFIMHPFDVGDRCEVDGVQMIVEEMNILTTVFLRYDNLKIIYPNSTLSQRPINNFYRSPDMGDAVEFCIHIATPIEKIAMMKQRIMSYVDGNKEHWCSSPMVIMKDVEELNSLRVAVWLCHKMNHQNMGERWARRALLIEDMVQMFKELDIQYRLLPIDVNLRSMPPIPSERMPCTWPTSTPPPSN